MKTAYEADYVDLLEVLKREERASVGYESDQIYRDQIDAFKRYVGENYGDEKPGRSSVHDRTVFEVIEWIRPDLTRIFTAGGSAATIEPWGEGTAQAADDASDYLNHLFMEEMEGESIVDTFAFDGLLQKRGVGAVYWQDAELAEPEEQELDVVRIQQLEQTGAVILGLEPTGEDTALVSFQRVRRQANPRVVMIAPEDFRIAARAISLEKPRYCGHVERHSKSDLKAQFPDLVDVIEEHANAEEETGEIDERRSQRFFDEDDMYASEIAASDLTAEVRLYREYIYHDKDGDGYAELLEVNRLDGVILTCEPVEDNPYFSWTPIPIPHRWFGLSVYDIAKDIQKTKTTLLRAALDSVYMSVAPRVMASQNVNLSDLLQVRPGAVVRTTGSGPVSNDVMPLVTPDLSGSALQMMEFVDQMGEARTGITRNAQGMDPDALNKTARGIKLMQNAASVRKEQVARNLGLGLEVMFRKIYRLVVQMTDKPRAIHAGKGKFNTYDPSQWPPEAKIRVHVGNGSGDRETQLGQLMQIIGLQREWVANFGPGNPIVGPKELHNTVEDIGRVMGMRGVDQYFKDPETIEQENPEALQALLQPKPDPKAEAEKAKLEMEGQRMQMQMQADQAKAEQNAQIEQAKVAQKAQMDQARAESERELAMFKAQQEASLATERAAFEASLAREKFEFEKQMAIERAAFEREMQKEKLAAMPAPEANGGFRPGGRLDQ